MSIARNRMEAMARSASRRGSGGGVGAGALAATGASFTVNVPTTSGGIGTNGKKDIAVLDVMPRLSVSIVESRYHGGGTRAAAVSPAEDPLAGAGL
jgi:hypothetical protein